MEHEDQEKQPSNGEVTEKQDEAETEEEGDGEGGDEEEDDSEEVRYSSPLCRKSINDLPARISNSS